jgi:hypothetical protein
MTRPLDLARVRRALALLRALAASFPRLRAPPARERLTNALDTEREEDERGDGHGETKA